MAKGLTMSASDGVQLPRREPAVKVVPESSREMAE